MTRCTTLNRFQDRIAGFLVDVTATGEVQLFDSVPLPQPANSRPRDYSLALLLLNFTNSINNDYVIITRLSDLSP